MNSNPESNNNELFSASLKKSGEIGYVEQVFPSLVYVKGLPGITLSEAVVFENGELGQVLSIASGYIEVLLFSHSKITVGSKATRVGKYIEIPLSDSLLGLTIDPLGRQIGTSKALANPQSRKIDSVPIGMAGRDTVKKPLESGVPIVDMLVPLGMGQRELILGDRKIGKSLFLWELCHNQANLGTICIYALVGKRQIDLKRLSAFCEERNISKNMVIVASTASDTSATIYLTPFTAMTIAEYFRDQGKDVLVVFDDLSVHAHCYREISLLAKRFPGRNSYPGDIFYLHSRLLERAGSFKKGSITALPVVESVLGDLSGYIQTNIMSITDGHLFFDSEVFNEGRRPAINHSLSVTRVGEQPQTPLVRDIGRQLSRFLSHYQRLKDLVHFGSEFEERVKKDMALGDRIFHFFNQPFDMLFPLNVSIAVIGFLWSGRWAEDPEEKMMKEIKNMLVLYLQNQAYKTKIDQLAKNSNFQSLVTFIRDQGNTLMN